MEDCFSVFLEIVLITASFFHDLYLMRVSEPSHWAVSVYNGMGASQSCLSAGLFAWVFLCVCTLDVFVTVVQQVFWRFSWLRSCAHARYVLR